MNLWRRLKLRLGGYVYLGERQEAGHRNPVPFYAFRCPVHGVVESHPHGYDGRLECPMCREAQG